MGLTTEAGTVRAQIESARESGRDAARSEAVAKQHSLGKLTARERIAALVDDGSFYEFGALVQPTRDTAFTGEVDAPGDGVVTGSARIDDRPVALASFDFTVAGGSNGTSGSLKMHRLVALARDEGVPVVMLLDGGGHRLQEGLDSWHFAWGFGLFREMVQLSGYVPIVSVMAGPNFGGPTNFAAMSDFVVMVRGISAMGIAGPALVRSATGEEVSKEDLGGADVQCRNGVADLAVDSEAEAFDAVRAFLSFLPTNSGHDAPAIDIADAHPDAADIAHVVPENPRVSYDVRSVVDALVDHRSVLEVRPTHAPNVVTALARLGGRPVGIVANQPQHLGGALDAAACDKVAHFVSVCDAFGIALLYLIDVPGFLGGSAAESNQLARRSGRMLFELGRASVPRFSVVMRKGYGAGFIAMCGGRSFDADLALAWPTAEIAATSVDGALDIAYRREIAGADDPAAHRAALHREFSAYINPLAAGQGFGVDDVVNPEQTRDLLIHALERKPRRHLVHTPAKSHPISPH
ncbi:acyl-CoA carboxylase subunit beta [Rhodococcus opacus]|uniref:acyl-CoA carboxylase subunit beta n=1 Tax=Rhodococcus opacus TaxID=37919 RepID=UPI00046D5236|nr:carboxyl transferase domain-containing protein [Rhodococcus opacus]UDH01219.1 acyl-CoA carboxylase subunit beta [Rhodococcus opacus PD630]